MILAIAGIPLQIEQAIDAGSTGNIRNFDVINFDYCNATISAPTEGLCDIQWYVDKP